MINNDNNLNANAREYLFKVMSVGKGRKKHDSEVQESWYRR
jgi:hypothetical protein